MQQCTAQTATALNNHHTTNERLQKLKAHQVVFVAVAAAAAKAESTSNGVCGSSSLQTLTLTTEGCLVTQVQELTVSMQQCTAELDTAVNNDQLPMSSCRSSKGASCTL